MEYQNVNASKDNQAHYDENKILSRPEPIYHKVSVESIQKHCLIIPYSNESQFVMEIIDQEMRANCFSEV